MSIVGTTLGKYRVLAELSSGGMGEVYRGQHEILGKQVAIKVIRAELTGDPQQVTRFINEARAASAIQHPGIIRIDDFGTTEDGRAYLVMELLEGMTLADRLLMRDKLPEAEAVAIARGIAFALQAAHEKGIFHRDLKPDNVFLVRDPDNAIGVRTKVLDFGIAKLTHVTGQTQTGALLGTPLYMAPEQARAAATVDHRADLYSLGCMLYELVVGQPPFTGSGAGELIAMQMFEAPVPPRKRGATISEELERVILRLLEKEPADRYASAAELVSALALRPAEKPAARAVEAAVPRPTNRLPIIAGGITVALAGLVAFALTRPSPAPKPAPAPAPAIVVEQPPPPKIEPPKPAPTPTPIPVVEKKPPKPARKRTVTSPAPAKDDQHTKTGSPIELTP